MTENNINSYINNYINPTDKVAKEDKMAKEFKKLQDMNFKLLMAQLRNQDIENTADTNQMTQLFLEMQNGQSLLSIKQELQSLNANMGQNLMQSMTGLIGKYALTRGDRFNLDQNSISMPISYQIPEAGLYRADIRILDSQNQVIHQDKIDEIKGLDMNDLQVKIRDEAGELLLEPGSYRVEILPYNKASNKPGKINLFTSNKIVQVLQDGSVITSDLEKLNLSDVISLQEKPSTLI
jgi:flagellar hook assembly protein FlgD